MHFTIIGAGSVGGYFGARLQQAGNSVTFLVRERRKRVLLEQGLVVRSPLGDAKLKVGAETSPEGVERCDVVMICVRNFDLEGILDSVGQFAERGASVVSLLNGVEHMERVRRLVPDERIIGGSAYIDSRLGPDGEVLHRSQDPALTLAPLRGCSPPTLRRVADTFVSAGVKTHSEDDLLLALWKKYLFVMLGTFTAVVEAPIGEVLGSAELTSTIESLLDELVAVANSTGVALGRTHAEAAMAELRRQRPGWTSLLYEDVLNHRRTEVDSLWGYVVRKAEENGVPAPLSRVCYGVLKLRGCMESPY